MQKTEAVKLEVERLLFELNCCVNDLQNLRLQISADEVHQLELILQKINTLMSYPRNKVSHFRLVAG